MKRTIPKRRLSRHTVRASESDFLTRFADMLRRHTGTVRMCRECIENERIGAELCEAPYRW